MERIAAWIAVLLAAAPVMAQQAPVAAPPPPDELALTEDELRMTVPVSIAGKGSWPFVIDTGAERSVLSRQLAERLGLAPGRAVRVTSMTGTAVTTTAQVPLLRAGGLAPALIEAPLYEKENMGAIGMLGLDALQDHAVAIDFDRGMMALRPSHRRTIVAHADEIVVIARSKLGQLIVTDAEWRGRRIAVVIDTGSPVTIANPALLRIGRRLPPAIGPMPVVAVTGAVLPAEGYRIDRLRIGSVTLGDVPVAVADAAPFRRFGLDGRPALLLGMETLRLFRAVEIDFSNRSIRLTLPRAVAAR